VDIDAFPLQEKKEDYYLAASRMVPYKKIGLVVEAFARMPQRRLVVVGDGPEYKKIKAKATPNVQILGYKSNAELRRYMQTARALVFPAEEDFGILPVEAQACGTPVIAFGRGGVTETVVDHKTGLFFDQQTPEAIINAVTRFESGPRLDPGLCRQNALRFSIERFRREFTDYVDYYIEAHRRKLSGQPGEMPSGKSNLPVLPRNIVLDHAAGSNRDSID
jgi:glycosyltransferase involved in cell wall biosynthesis